jgi:hypothetical protein
MGTQAWMLEIIRGRLAAAVLLLPALVSLESRPDEVPSPGSPAVVALAEKLRRLYARPGDPGERWRRRSPEVVLEGGVRVPREAAYRDDPAFVVAARELLRNRNGDDAVLGAWLLGTAPPAQRDAATSALVAALRASDPRVRFEAARALGTLLSPQAAAPLRELIVRGAPPESAAARWALRRVAPHQEVATHEGRGLASGFCRGVNWWHEETGRDAGAASFGRLAELGVDWVSIHSWDPLQRDAHAPAWPDERRPLAIPGLAELVRSAHAAGIKVMVKPHLEMRGYEPTAEERRILRGSDAAAREALVSRIRETWSRPRAWHNDIEMTNEADWRQWFSQYEGYVLAYARQAAEAGADAFCVGRETDKAAMARPADWRRIIARVRETFAGALTYSANFDTYDRIAFWDALDVIGVSAYFPLGDGVPTEESLAAAWDATLARLESLSRKANRRVVFTEIGYPAVPTAASRPWNEPPGPADVWLQARLYDAVLKAVSKRPFMAGTFFWLWEGVARPAFRDPSFSIQDKPASFVMADWYGR